MPKTAKKTPAKKNAKPATKINSKTAPKSKEKPAAKTAAKNTKPASNAAPKKPAPVAAKPVKKIKPYKKVKLPEGYKLNEKDEYMNPQQLEFFRRKLVDWKAELSRELSETLDNLKEENWQEPDITDRATVETDTGIELRTRDRYRKLINKINSALDRIERGEYGYCEETGDEIGIKRLQARPIATMTVEAQERHERDERTHYDEDMEERI